MPRFESSPEFEHGLPESLGVLLVNTGTPDAPTPEAVRRYLKEFLSDRRVVELPRLLWLPVLYGYILRTRPVESAAAYRKIWTDQGSPLLLHMKDIASALQEKLSVRLSGATHVEIGMSYGKPSIDSALASLYQNFARRLLVMPMYPQYSGSSTGSVFDAVTAALKRRRWIPELHFINHYHDSAGYISALAASTRDFWDLHGRGERLLFSFHGLPRRMLDEGDPYHCQCHKTARLVAESLELDEGDWQVGFQSRLGRQEWLRPYTDDILESWAAEKLGKIDVISPCFAVDCLETLEEIAIRYASDFSAAGGGELRYIPALNARDDHISFLSRLIERNVAGWPEASPDWSLSEAAREMDKSLQRARAMGAER
jgi:ferrochelatase